MVKNLCTSRLLLTQIFHSSYFYHYQFLFSLFVFTISFVIMICVHPRGLLTHNLWMSLLLTLSADTDCPHGFYIFLPRGTRQATLKGEKSCSRISNNIKHENYSDLCCWFVKISKAFQYCSEPGGKLASHQISFRDILSFVQNYTKRNYYSWG